MVRYKKVLEHKINQVKGFEKATIRRYDNQIEVSGTITFRFEDNCEILLWNTCSRHSGGEVALADLNRVQGLVRELEKKKVKKFNALFGND